MRIGSWNVNSIRSRVSQVVSWLEERSIDVALLQETKCGDAAFPFRRFADAGYEVAHHGVNQWNGVAIASRVGLDDVSFGFATSDEFPDPRLIAADCGGIRCWSVYVPNGRSIDDPQFRHKLKWLAQLAIELAHHGAAERTSIVAGDFNVGMSDADFYDPSRWRNKKHATPEERRAVRLTLDLGLVDLARHLDSEGRIFTWWNYVGTQFAKDKGLRIDLALGSAPVVGVIDDVWVDRHARDPLVVHPETPSDHAPLIVDLL